jgi:hypothetical protein
MRQSNFFESIPAIKEHYRHLTPLILNRSNIHPKRWVDPYCEIDWASMFSPIEEMAWCAIRSIGSIPMYPQYPVLKYFVDFGNPFLKIAIECDGKQFHKDVEKDEYRDLKLEKNGWSVFRISGSDCFRVDSNYYSDREMGEKEKRSVSYNFYTNTIEGLIKSLAIFYCGHKLFIAEAEDINYAAECLQRRCSANYDALNEIIESVLYERLG